MFQKLKMAQQETRKVAEMQKQFKRNVKQSRTSLRHHNHEVTLGLC